MLKANVSGNSYVDNNVPDGDHVWKIVRKCEGGSNSHDTLLRGNCEEGNAIDEIPVTTNNISVYPNPARDNINITGENIHRVQIINLEGRIVGDIRLNNDTDKHTLNVGDYLDGLYMFKIYSGDKVITKKIIIKK